MNNKGSFKDDGSTGSKFKKFFKESGFYIAIVVGVCALAAGAVFFSTNQILTDPNQNAKEEDQNDGINYGLTDFGQDDTGLGSEESSITDGQGSEIAQNGTEQDLTSQDDASGIEEGPVGQGEPDGTNDTAQNDTAQTGNSDTAQNTNGDSQAASGNVVGGSEDNSATADVVLAVVKPNFQTPVNGKIQNDYSMDKLVFSPTFNEWRTHSGVDISAPRGEVVKSCGNGVILEIKNDPRFGFTIVIDHKNGYKSLYANLASDKTMQVGQEVKLGDTIGSIGATAIFESAEPTHLHFEVYKENKLVNPADYIDFVQ